MTAYGLLVRLLWALVFTVVLTVLYAIWDPFAYAMAWTAVAWSYHFIGLGMVVALVIADHRARTR